MYVCLLEIDGFRGIRSARIALEQHSALLGINNVGKSAIIDALGLVLGRDRLVRTLGDYDFTGGLPKPSTRIRIKAAITGFARNDPAELPAWFNTRDGATPFWWDGKKVVPGDQPSGAKLYAQVAFVARFDHETLEAETVRYFWDGEGDPFEATDIVTVKQSHLKEIGFFLLPSHRTWDRVVSFGSELFRRVLRFQSAIPSDAVTDLRSYLRNPTVKLEEDPRICDLIGRVNAELTGFMGRDEAGLQFRPTGGDIEGVLQAITPHLQGKADTVLPISRHGSGVISLQTLLLLFEFGRARNEQAENFILAAEEPELHLHPGHHRRLVSRIRGVSDQSLTTTHSPEIAAYFRPSEILILRNNDGNVQATPLIASGDTMPDKNALMRLFTLYRKEICEALMHRVVLLPEGITEYRWLNALFRLCIAAEGWDHPEEEIDCSHAVGIIPTQDSHVVATFDRFQQLVPTLVPMVDGDNAGNEYVRQLMRASTPPRTIIQLDEDAVLETLIARIALPSSGEEWQRLREIVEGFLDATTVECLTERLIANKQNWRIHEQVVAFIADSEERCQRARTFLTSLSLLAYSGTLESELWKPDKVKSTGTTTVWRSQP